MDWWLQSLGHGQFKKQRGLKPWPDPDAGCILWPEKKTYFLLFRGRKPVSSPSRKEAFSSLYVSKMLNWKSDFSTFFLFSSLSSFIWMRFSCLTFSSVLNSLPKEASLPHLAIIPNIPGLKIIPRWRISYQESRISQNKRERE